jgi:hypothetical protein
MAKQKHTTGPWAVNPVTAHVDAFTEDGPLAVCALLWPTELRSEAETGANAALIAAAPDLLEAAKFAYAAMDSNEGRERARKSLIVAIANAESA